VPLWRCNINVRGILSINLPYIAGKLNKEQG